MHSLVTTKINKQKQTNKQTNKDFEDCSKITECILNASEGVIAISFPVHCSVILFS